MRKQLPCNKYKAKTFCKLNRDKTITGLYDCDNNPLVVGDIVEFNKNYVGLLQYERMSKCFGIYMSKYYGDNPLDPYNYYEFIEVPFDNGMKMHLKRIGHVGDKIPTKYGNIL